MSLHSAIFGKVLHSTIDFVWTTPLGQIANRFSKDTDEIDVALPNTCKNFLNQVRAMSTLDNNPGYDKLRAYEVKIGKAKP